MTSSTTRYSSVSITLHWLMFLLIVAVYACIELREYYPKGSDPRNALKAWHFTLGLSVLTLVVLRIAARAIYPAPAALSDLPLWQRQLASVTHILLYALMICMPIAGWVILSGEAKPVPFWGGLQLPPLIAENKPLAELVEEVHGTVGNIGYFLIGLHALGALAHHYVLKDSTLKRMLPGS
ncbi:MAG: cytochrome b [Hyphomicrobium sp.]